MRQATGGAAPFAAEVQRAAGAKMAPGCVVAQVYGLTETTGAITHTPIGRLDTVGSLSPLLPNVLLR